jgi:large subunit ribosomal protein L29
MKAFEIRSMSDDEIQAKLEEVYEELFNLRFQYAIGQAKDANQMRMLKRDVARMKTILNERKLAAEVEVSFS